MRSLLALPLLLTACSDYETNRAKTTDSFSQAPSNEVDILWVVDNSTSMTEEQDSVVKAAADFMNQLESADMDFHLGVVTTDMDDSNENAGALMGSPRYLTSECRDDGDTSDCTYQAAFQARIAQGTGGSDQEKGIGAAKAAVTAPMTDTVNYGFLRDGALLMVIILADENDCTDDGALGANSTGQDCYTEYDKLTPVANLVRDLEEAKEGQGGVVMSGIVGPDVEDHCADSVPGKRYTTAIRMTGGVDADICLEDYAPIMSSLGLVATGILDTFQLSHLAVADDEECPIEVSVDPEDGDAYEVTGDEAEGWTYDDEYAQIIFHGDSVPPRGSTVEVTYCVAGNVPTPEE